MSHVTTIKQVPLTDKLAIQMAVQELNKMGIKCKLHENTDMIYYRQKSERCDLVLRFNEDITQTNRDYDIGFKLNKDNAYEIVVDPYGGSVARNIGVKNAEQCPIHATQEQKTIGSFMQQYTRFATVNLAQKRGMAVRESFIDDRGNVQLRLAQRS